MFGMMLGMSVTGNILSSALAGVLAGLTLTVAGWWTNRARSKLIERKLRRNLEHKGFGTGIDGFSIPVQNDTDVAVIVRGVFLNLPHIGDLELNYTEREKVFENRALTAPPTATAGSLLHEAQLERRFVALPAHVEGRWRIPDGLFSTFNVPLDEFKVLACRIEFEYETLLKDRVVTNVVAGEAAVKILNSGLQHFIKEIPKINAIRPMWGKPPIEPGIQARSS